MESTTADRTTETVITQGVNIYNAAPALYVSPEIANLYSSFPVREDMQSITPATIAKPLSKYNRLIPECVTCQLFATKIVSIIR